MLNEKAVFQEFVFTEHPQSLDNTNNDISRSEDIRYGSSVTNLNGEQPLSTSAVDKINSFEGIESMSTVNAKSTSSLVFSNDVLIKYSAEDGMGSTSIQQSKALVMSDIPHCDEQQSLPAPRMQVKEFMVDIEAEDEEMSSNESMEDRSSDDVEMSNIMQHPADVKKDVPTFSNGRMYSMYWESERNSVGVQCESEELESSSGGEPDCDVEVSRKST